MKTIDLNCDMGESYGAWKMGADAATMPLISSANIACGFHAGDPATIRATVRLAVEHGVAIGAHPSLPDLAGFGRRAMKISPQEMYDLVIVDCPPSLGLLTVNALTAANGCLIPMQCEYYALEGISSLLTTIELIRRHLNPDLKITGVLLTMVDARTRLSEQVAAEVRRHFGGQVFDTVVPRSVRLAEAPSHGRPILSYAPESKGAVAYLNVAREVVARVGLERPAEALNHAGASETVVAASSEVGGDLVHG